jgi:hypothetical protein
MIKATRALLSGLDIFKFKGPKWSPTRQRNWTARMQKEQSVIQCLKDSKKVQEEYAQGKLVSMLFILFLFFLSHSLAVLTFRLASIAK